MSLHIKPKSELSDFEKQYLTDRLIDWREFITDEPTEQDESEQDEEPADDADTEADEVDETESTEEDAEDVPYSEWENDELREELKRRNLKQSGKKDELIARLEANDAESDDEVDA